MTAGQPDPSVKASAEAPAKDRSRRILLNTLTSYADDVIDAISMLILVPFLIHTLGKDNFGLWSLIWAYLGIFELADFGFGASVVKYVADSKGRGDVGRLRKVVGTLFYVYCVLGGLVMLGVAASLLFFNRIFDIPAGMRAAAIVVLFVLGVRAALLMPLGLFRGVLGGYQKASVANVYKSIAAVLYLILVIAVLRRVPDLRALALISLAMGILPLLAMAVHARRTVPGVGVHPRNFDRGTIREVSSFSFYFTIIQVSRFIYTRVDSLIIKVFLPLETVAVYAIAMRLSEKASQFCFHLIKNMTPVAAELHATRDTQNIRAVLKRGTKLSVAFATPLLVGLAVLAGPMIRAWTGPGFELAVPACQLLVAAAMVNVIHGISATVLSMGGEHKFMAWTSLASQVLNVVLSIALIVPFGMVGVAAATLIASLPFQVIGVQGRTCRAYGISPVDFYWHGVWPSVLPCLAMVAVFYGVQWVWPITNLVEVAVLEALGVGLFGTAFWILGLTAHEREYFRERVFARLRGRKDSHAA